MHSAWNRSWSGAPSAKAAIQASSASRDGSTRAPPASANAIAPGGTATGIAVNADPAAHGPAALGPHFVNLGRLARPEEQAAAILFLASDAASNINGAILPVDDGWAAV